MTEDDPGPEGGERLWPGFVVVAALAIALTAVLVFDGGGSSPVPTPTVTFGTDPTLLPATTPAPTSTSEELPTTSDVPPTTQQPPTTVVPVTTVAPVTTAAVTTTSITASPIGAARDALAAWGRFAVSGDLDDLDGYFHPDGPQWEQLAEEAETLADDPLGPPAYTVTLRQARVAESEPNGDVVRGWVTFVRRGEPDQGYRWDLVMVPGDEGEWLLWTVAERG